MPYPGYLGARERTHDIKRVRLLSGEQWVKGEGVAGAPPPPVGATGESGLRRPTWARSSKVTIETQNQYGYTSASAAKFPEAFKPVDTKFWQPLTQEETSDIHMRQAQANLKASFSEDDKAMRIGATVADADYADAQSMRNTSLRRRRKAMNYDERKKLAEELKKLPLTRKYVTGEAAFRESSAIVQSGPLDTPILVSGLPTVDKGDSGPGPAKLKLKKRGRRGQGAGADDKPANPYAEITLPSFNPDSAPKARLLNFRNSWGLASRSEMMYPEAYKDLSTVYWKPLTKQEQFQVTTVQARAMEKAGYERGTEKLFIEEIEPDSGYVYKGGRTDDTAGRRNGTDIETWIVLIVIAAIVAGIGYSAWSSSNAAPAPRDVAPYLAGE